MKRPSLQDRLAVREMPSAPPVMFQTWSNLLFLHWEVEASALRKRIPNRLGIDDYQGKCYLGIVPFFMQKVRPRFLPGLPWLSNFLELNVRTYVYDESGRPGVWFFSLDCNQPVAVEIARRFFHLPYQHARMSVDRDRHHCQRKGQRETACYQYEVRQENLETAIPGSLEFFLLERYLLFSKAPGGHLHCGRVHHHPYQYHPLPLGPESLVPLKWEGFEVEGQPVSALASPGVPVGIHSLEKVIGSR